MDKQLSEDSLDLLRDMKNSEAWKIYEAIQQERIREMRVLATQQSVKLEDRLWYSAEAQGRENPLIELNDLLYGRQHGERKTSSNG